MAESYNHLRRPGPTRSKLVILVNLSGPGSVRQRVFEIFILKSFGRRLLKRFRRRCRLSRIFRQFKKFRRRLIKIEQKYSKHAFNSLLSDAGNSKRERVKRGDAYQRPTCPSPPGVVPPPLACDRRSLGRAARAHATRQTRASLACLGRTRSPWGSACKCKC